MLSRGSLIVNQIKPSTHRNKPTPRNPKTTKVKACRTVSKIEAFCTLPIFHGASPKSGGLRIKGTDGQNWIVDGTADRIVLVAAGASKAQRKVYELIATTPGYVPDAERDKQIIAVDANTGDHIRLTGVRRKPKTQSKAQAVVESKAPTATAIDAKPARTPLEASAPRSKRRERTDADLARDLEALRIKRDAGFDPPVNIKTACALWDRSVSAVRSDVRLGLIPAPIKIGCRVYFPCSVVVSRMAGKPLGTTMKGIDYLDRPFG
jgi:hypothetical protein